MCSLGFSWLDWPHVNIIHIDALSVKKNYRKWQNHYRLNYTCVKYAQFVSFCVLSMFVFMLRTITLSLDFLFTWWKRLELINSFIQTFRRKICRQFAPPNMRNWIVERRILVLSHLSFFFLGYKFLKCLLGACKSWLMCMI